MPKYELFNFWKSSCSWRVRIALAWKGIEYEYRPVNLAASGGGEQHLDSYRKLNPNQRVPTLVVDGHALAQSGAILEYLEEAHPEKPLLPRDLLQRAQVRNLCGIVGCDTQPAQSMGLSAKVADLQSPATADERLALVVAWNAQWISRGLQAFEDELARSAGRYCVGDEVTLADVYLLPQVFNARVCNVDVASYPTISRVVATLEQLPAFASSRPDIQPDAIRA
ncbi:Maleylacetoacetate isomerase [Phytophthora cinnamomi]|uniref:Maleylacetoacetate isomerase n=1 Tax=Phytophthora cinnamomi TaxID=4785 RepID=UPI003559DD50|nr:Maleylacetoacetate isomerase [Phytophthora cinnamomi]